LALGIFRGFLADVQDVLAFKIARLSNAEEPAEYAGLIAQNGFDLGWRPDEKLALFTLAVGVGSRVEAALGAGHLPQDIVEGLLGDAAVHATRSGLVGV